MRELSRGHTIALPQNIIRHEVRAALVDVLEIPSSEGAYSPFGVGLDHAIGTPILAEMLAASTIPPGYRAAVLNPLELRALAGPEVDLRDLPSEFPRMTRDRNKKYIERREELAENMRTWSRDGDRADRFTMAAELVEMLEIIDEVALPLGVSSADLVSRGKEAMGRFLSLMPMHSIVTYMHRASVLSDRPWKVNDHNDVVYLASAAAYCDAVVGEKHWTAKLREPRCPTVASHILNSPEELRLLIESL